MKKEKLVYVEPADYFPEDIRKKHGLGEYAPGKTEYEKLPETLKQVCSKEKWEQMTVYEQRSELAEWERTLSPNDLTLDGPGTIPLPMKNK